MQIHGTALLRKSLMCFENEEEAIITGINNWKLSCHIQFFTLTLVNLFIDYKTTNESPIMSVMFFILFHQFSNLMDLFKELE